MPMSPAKMVRYASLGAEATSPPIGGVVAGYYLDQYFGTYPKLTLALLVIGVVLGFYRLIAAGAKLRDEPR
jgi:F0F1-type ATP synthase assembly protein I